MIETARAQGSSPAHSLARPVARSPCQPTWSSLLQSGLVRRIGEVLGLARRAGQAVAGFQKAREWLRTGRAGLVIQASDGSEGERRRLFSAAGAKAGDDAGVPAVAPLRAAALGRVFGRDHVVHVAVATGRLAEALATEAARLTGLGPAGRAGQTECCRRPCRTEDRTNE